MRWVARAVAVLIGLPLLAVLGLLAAGQREAAGRNVEKVAVARPPAQVFRYLEDEQLVKKWTGLAEVERLTEGELRPGARLRLVSEARGHRTEMDCEVTAVERDRHLVFAVTSHMGAPVSFKALVEYRLEGRDAGTRLTVTRETRYEDLIPRLLEPLITH